MAHNLFIGRGPIYRARGTRASLLRSHG